ncbi:MAG: EamA family transporter [Planctomycetota bacterium]|nr:EamA family transporter [Planctomycetota bacterium]
MTPSPPSPERRAANLATMTLLAILCVVWSSTWWAIRVCLESQPPITSCAVRFTIAGLAMAAVTPWLRARERAPAPATWLWVVCGLTNFGVGYGVLYIAETVVPSGIAAVLWAIFPLLMAGSATLFLGERLRRVQWSGFAVSFAGICVVFSGDLGGVDDANAGYAWLLLLSPLVAALGTTVVKKYGSDASSVVLNRNGMLVGAAMLTAWAFLSEEPMATTWTARVTMATAYLAILGTTMTFGIYFWLLRTAPASLLALINYAIPVLAMLFAALVGDGQHGPLAWSGAGLVVLGIALVVRR